MVKMPRYKLKCLNEDFKVSEVSLVPNLYGKNDSDYTYLTLSKSGLTTFQAQDELKNFFAIDYKDIGVEGLKDEDAITTQIISIKKIVSTKEINNFNIQQKRNEGFIVIDNIVGYGLVPVRPGILHGNCFRVVLRNLTEKTASQIRDYFTKNRSFDFINYYDSQRFGTPKSCHNTHIIGKAIVDGDWLKAFSEIVKSKNEEANKIKNIKSTTQEAAKDSILENINPNKIKFFVSAYCSELWNRGLSEHISAHNETIKHSFKYVGEMSLPRKEIFLIQNVFECSAHELSIDDLVVGTKVFKRPSSVNTTLKIEDIIEDDIHKGKRKLAINFFLPTGSYGTMLIRQLFIRLQKNEKQ